MRWPLFTNRQRADAEQGQELQSYLEIATDEYIARGMTPDAARAAALHKLGNPTLIREEIYRMNTVAFLDTLARDAGYALRSMRHNPVFTTVAVLTLALGVGANSTLFSLVNIVLIQPLPYPDSQSLVRIWSSTANAPRAATATPDYKEWRGRSHSFEELGLFTSLTYNLTEGERPERIQAARVTASLWSVLRIQPLMGRLFDTSDEHWGSHRIVLLSEGLWRRRFGADTGVVGKNLQLNGEPYTVAGVLPAKSQFPDPRTELWTPVSFAPGDTNDSRNNYFSDVIARLKPQTSLADAQRELSGVALQIAADVPLNKGRGVTLLRLQDTYTANIRPTLLLLSGSAGVVLLIACCNVASLLLARASVRRRELTVRVALGAGQARLIRQLLTESLVLAAAGSTLGLGVAYTLLRTLLYLAPPGIPRIQEASLDGTVLAFTAATALLTGLGFGIWPAWHAVRLDVAEGLKESARGATAVGSGGRVRRLLVVVQIALSLVLLIGANLLIISLIKVQRVAPGFAPDHLLTMRVTMPSHYAPERYVALMQETANAIATLPGISAAAATTSLPLGGSGWGKYFSIEGRPVPPSLSDVPNVNYRQITPDYFRTMKATLRRGRFFADQDRPDDPPVAIVNETLARRFWPQGDPIGKRIALLPPEPLMPEQMRPAYARSLMTIVGVVADLRTLGLETDPDPEVFAPVSQAGLQTQYSFFAVGRTAGDPLSYARAVEATIHRLDNSLPVAGIQSMETRLGNSLSQRRFSLFLLGLFAGLALILTVIGLGGVIAYAVNQRTREMGVRATLGASASDLVRLVVGQGLALAVTGVLIGMAAAALMSSLIAKELFEVKPIDPLVYVATAVLLLMLAALACWVPGRRAALTDPAATLRSD
jgi:putative ABC transport system permease protein